MDTRFLRVKAKVAALSTVALLGPVLLSARSAEAVSPGASGRTVYLKGNDIRIFDGRFNHALTDNGLWQDRVTWCGNSAIVGDETGVGIVVIPIDDHTNAGSPITIYSDPGNAAADPSCNARGTEVAVVVNDTVFKIPTNGRTGLTPVATTASGGPAHEPTWSSDDRAIAFEDAVANGFSQIEIASANGRFLAGGTAVTPTEPGLRHGPSWRDDTIYYWKQTGATVPSLGIFSVRVGHLTEVGPYGGTQAFACKDPAALPDGSGFECVGSDTTIKVFPGPSTLNGTDASKPDVERIRRHHDEHDHGEHEHHK